jgi:hypothetical protein
VATIHNTRCPGCGVFLPDAPDPDDYGDNERAYHQDIDRRWELHDCPVLEGNGPRRETVTRARRAERPRTTATRQRSRMHRFLCACPDAQPIRAATTDLSHLVCGKCDSYLVWSPTASELDDDALAGRRPA